MAAQAAPLEDPHRQHHEQMLRDTAEAEEHHREQARQVRKSTKEARLPAADTSFLLKIWQEEVQRLIELKELAAANAHADAIEREEARLREEETLEFHRREAEEERFHQEESDLLDRKTEEERREREEWMYDENRNSTIHELEIQERLREEREDAKARAKKDIARQELADGPAVGQPIRSEL